MDILSTTGNPELSETLTPILFGAAAFQYLNAGCELGLFELLRSHGPLSKQDIALRLELQSRPADILLLGTTSLQLTTVKDGLYRNSDAVDALFDAEKWKAFKDIVGFEQHVVYAGQEDFAESLRANSNIGLRRVRGHGRDLYHRLSENPNMERAFYSYMRSFSELVNPVLVDKINFKEVRKLLDVGGGDAVNSMAIATAYDHLKVTMVEIPATAGIAEKKIASAGLSDRVNVLPGDMFADPFPKGYDCILFAHQFVIWTPEENTALLRKAYDALEPGGRVIVFNSISSDAGDGPLMAALDSVYFAAIPAQGGMIYNWSQYESWFRQANFRDIERINCYGWTPHGAVVGYKR